MMQGYRRSAVQLFRFCICMAVVGSGVCGYASDHADPIDPLHLQQQEGAITDLYVFPVTADGKPAHAFQRASGLPLNDPLADVLREPLSQSQRVEIDSLVFILCVRRNLAKSAELQLSPYEYRIHIDLDSSIVFPPTSTAETGIDDQMKGYSRGDHDHLDLAEAFARYGGKVSKPEYIKEDIRLDFRLDNQANLVDDVEFEGVGTIGWAPNDVLATAGFFEDPFIFPGFSGKNVVGIVCRVPFSKFPKDKSDYLVWASSHRGSKQIDHAGRALRTQNPRFNVLNTLHPSRHKKRLLAEHMNPSLFRDIKLRLNLGSLFAFRSWDFEPDVMCYSSKYPAGFPNGRLLTDDVVAILAQHGDGLLYELSHQDNNYRWPRQQTNDANGGVFQTKFPYLNPPFENVTPVRPQRLSASSIAKLVAIGLLLLALLVLENVIVAKLYHLYKTRRRYL